MMTVPLGLNPVCNPIYRLLKECVIVLQFFFFNCGTIKSLVINYLFETRSLFLFFFVDALNEGVKFFFFFGEEKPI